MKYKALITDLDGTAILNQQYAQPTQRVIEAVEKAQKIIKVAAATGRPISTANWVIKPLKLTSPCIITAGTQIIDPLSQKILWEETMPEEIVKKVLKVVDAMPYRAILSSQYITHPEQPRPTTIHDEGVIYIGWVPLEESATVISAIKQVALVNVNEAQGYPPNTVGLHVTSKNATKKHAVEELISLLGIQKEEVIGVGDSNNDLPLFDAVGLKIAMGNATERLKDSADFVAPPVEEDGLAYVIEKFILSS
ncbi:MAG TPA: HAD family hydrolase [Patescibacteria group bacterium]|nr:HAD family hydrolase [Patescibacteria group bacterium]